MPNTTPITDSTDQDQQLVEKLIKLNLINYENDRIIYLSELFETASEIYIEEDFNGTHIRLRHGQNFSHVDSDALQTIVWEHSDFDIFSNHVKIILSILDHAKNCKKFSYVSSIKNCDFIHFYDLVSIPESLRSLHLETDIGLDNYSILEGLTDLTINNYHFSCHFFPSSLKRLTIGNCPETYKPHLINLCKKLDISLTINNN